MLIQRSAFLTIILLLLALPTLSPAQTADSSFKGIVTHDRVNLRSGGGTNYYPLGQMNKGQIVTVRKELYGWYQIDPLPNSFSYIAKAFVKRSTDQRYGVVTGDRVRVRAPHPQGSDPSKSYRSQLQLAKNTTVQILGVDGDYYKIVPPKGVTHFVKNDFIRRATPKEIADAPAPKPIGLPETTAPTTPQPSTTPSAPSTSSTSSLPTVQLKSVTIHIDADGQISHQGKPLALELLLSELKKLQAVHPIQVTASADADLQADQLAAIVTPIRSTGAVVKLKDDQSANATTQPTPDPVTPPTPTTTIVPPKDFTPPAAPKVKLAPKAPQPPQNTKTPGTSTSGKPGTPKSHLPTTTVVDTKPTQHSKLRELETRFEAMSKKPLVDQDILPLKLAYTKLQSLEDLSDRDQAFIKSRVTLLEDRYQQQSVVREIRHLKAQIAQSDKERADKEAAKPRVYNVIGRLSTSPLYNGQRLPRLYRITDPLTHKTLAYLRPTADTQQRIVRIIGQYVGVVGTKHYDDGLKIYMIHAEAIDLLTNPKQD